MLTRLDRLSCVVGLAVAALASSDLALSADSSSTGPQTSSTESQLQTVIVTAQKKQERLLDVPVPVTSVNASDLTDSGRLTLSDYYTDFPGLSYSPAAPNEGAFTIRGLGSLGGSVSVGVLIDGVPFGSSGGLGNQLSLPDIDPSALSRIEVLRGPQGTLFGASGIGGVVNFVTIAPSTDSFSGRVQADLDAVYDGNTPGYSGRGSVNIPLSDTFAVRADVYARHDPGYVTNVRNGESGVNWGDAGGGHLAALWTPSEAFSAEFSGLLQNNTTHGSPLVLMAPGSGDLQQDFLPGTGGSHGDIQNYSLLLKAKLGLFDLTSNSTFSDDYSATSEDNTSTGFGRAVQTVFPDASSVNEALLDTKKYTEELHLTTTIAQKVDWLLGLFYTDERATAIEPDYAVDPNSLANLGDFANFSWWSTYQESAAFTVFTIHFTDRFDVQIGGRESKNRQSYYEVDSGPYVPEFEGLPSPAVYPTLHTDQSSFTYLFTPQYKFNEDLMAYIRLSSGYRPGGPNFNDYGTLAAQVPPSYGSDSTRNYEIGVKGQAFDRRLTFDSSIYYIDWRNVQLGFLNPVLFIGYLANGTDAKSEGFELSVQAKPLESLTLGGWLALNRAQLTEDFPTTAQIPGQAGDVLPNAPHFTGSAFAEQQFPLGTGKTGFLRVQDSYVGRQFVTLAVPGIPAIPGYARLDLQAGLRASSWTAALYATNLADRRGILEGGPGSSFPRNYYYLIPPRTIGLTVTKSF